MKRVRSCPASSGARAGEAGGNELSALGTSLPGRAVPQSSERSVLQAWYLGWRGEGPVPARRLR